VATATEKLSYESFDPVPHQRIADLAADSNPQSTLSALIALTDNNEIG
jgi:hypothetical protein